MRTFFILSGILLNMIGMALVYTEGDTVAALCAGFAGAVSVLIGMFLDDILNAN